MDARRLHYGFFSLPVSFVFEHERAHRFYSDFLLSLMRRSDIYQVYIVLLFVVLTLVLSVALLNTLVAMFASTYDQVMGAAQAEWLLQRAQILLLIERVLYFLPAVFLYPLGYRVLQASKGKRKTILRFVQLPGG